MDHLGLGVEGETTPLDEALAGPERPPGPQDLGDALQEAPPAAPDPAPAPSEPAPEAPTEPPAAPEEPTDPAQTPPPDPNEPPEPAPELLAGRFKTPEDAVEAWKHAQSWATKEQQARRAAEDRVRDIQTKLQNELPRLIEEEIRRRSGMDPDEDQPAITPEKVQELVQKEAQRLTQEQEQSRMRSEVTTHWSDFRTAHPEVDEPLGQEVVNLFGLYRSQLDDDDQREFLPTKDRLESVYQLVQNPRVKTMLDNLNLVPDPEAVSICEELVAKPELAKVVQAHPHVVESEAGMEWARDQAGRPQAMQSQAQQDLAQRKAAEAEQARIAAHVETGSTGAPGGTAPAQSDEQWFIDRVTSDTPDNALGL